MPVCGANKVGYVFQNFRMWQLIYDMSLGLSVLCGRMYGGDLYGRRCPTCRDGGKMPHRNQRMILHAWSSPGSLRLWVVVGS